MFTTSPAVLKCPLLLASHLFPLNLCLRTGCDSKTFTSSAILCCHMQSYRLTGRILEKKKFAAWVPLEWSPLLSVRYQVWLLSGSGREKRGCPPFTLCCFTKAFTSPSFFALLFFSSHSSWASKRQHRHKQAITQASFFTAFLVIRAETWKYKESFYLNNATENLSEKKTLKKWDKWYIQTVTGLFWTSLSLIFFELKFKDDSAVASLRWSEICGWLW